MLLRRTMIQTPRQLEPKGIRKFYAKQEVCRTTTVSKYLKFGGATVLIVVALGYLAYTGVQENKSYYVTIKELRSMGDSAHAKRLRVGGIVQPGSIKRTGSKVEFVLVEKDQLLNVVYSGTKSPPDTFKDESQALAEGSFGHEGFPRQPTASEVRLQVCATAN